MSFFGSLASKVAHVIAAPIKGAAHLVTDPSKAISNIGKSVAPVYHAAATGAGGVGGFLVGGPAGAIAGAKLGDKVGNIAQDTLSGANVGKNLKDNLIGAGEAGVGGYLAAGLPGLPSIPGIGTGGSAAASGAGGGYAGAGSIADANVGSTGGGGWSSVLGSVFNSNNAPALISAGSNLVGGYLQGKAQGAVTEAEMKERQREYDQTYGLQAGQQALSTQKSLDTAGIRDRAQYLLQQRLGMTPSTFQPHDLFNQGTSAATPHYGGYDPAALASANAAYTPGAGGVNTNVQQQLLKTLGYPRGGAA